MKFKQHSISSLLCVLFFIFCFQTEAKTDDVFMPPPFYRVLYVTSPPFQGNDVYVLQNLIARSPYVQQINITSEYDEQTANAVSSFQTGNNIENVNLGVFNRSTAELLLELHSCDWYSDNGVSAGSQGYLYKMIFQVFENRSYETIASLYDANNTLRHQFRVRLHGHDNAYTNPAWPSWSNTVGLNQFTSDGNTPTGLSACDLNSPEPDIMEYGPFPITRFVKGIDGNAKFILTETNAIRTGILLHTGIWYSYGWTPKDQMPNSEGCVHSHPEDIEKIWKILVSLGVDVRPNPGGVQPYPYQPQGLCSVVQVGCQ